MPGDKNGSRVTAVVGRFCCLKEGLIDRNRNVNLIFLMLVLFALTFVIGCGSSGGAGVKRGGDKDVVYEGTHAAKKRPPPWAPARGHRKKYQYHYYPGCFIYYDTGRNLYFYIEGDFWAVSASLPNHLYEDLGGYVVVDLTTDKPYTFHTEHKKKYPPGKAKKNKSDKWGSKEKK